MSDIYVYQHLYLHVAIHMYDLLHQFAFFPPVAFLPEPLRRCFHSPACCLALLHRSGRRISSFTDILRRLFMLSCVVSPFLLILCLLIS